MDRNTSNSQAFASSLISQNRVVYSEQLSSLQAKLAEYDQLGQVLLDNSRKSTVECMIPLSDVGFLRGKMKHTSEVLVFLGDQYFVERTATECQGIIGRRKQLVQKQISEV